MKMFVPAGKKNPMITSINHHKSKTEIISATDTPPSLILPTRAKLPESMDANFLYQKIIFSIANLE